MITLQSSVFIPENVLFQMLDGEAVLLNLSTGKYFGLDEVGADMWQLIADKKNLEAVYQVLLAEYDVEEDRLQNDLINLVNTLVEKGLLSLVAIKGMS